MKAEPIKSEPTKTEPAKKELNPTLPLVSNEKSKFEVDKKIGTYNGAATDKYNWSQSI